MKKFTPLVGVAILLVASAALKASNPDSPFRLGLQVSYANPYGDMSDLAGPGFGVGLVGEWALGKHFGIRARADFMRFGEEKTEKILVLIDDIGVRVDRETKCDAWGLSADFVYRADTHDIGFYGFAGLGFTDIKLNQEIVFEGSVFDNESDSCSSSGFSFSTGIGYNFTRNVGIETKYTVSPSREFTADKNKSDCLWYIMKGKPLSADCSWLQVSFCYRF